VNYSVIDLNVQVESTTGIAGITGESKTKHPRAPRVPRGLLFLNTKVKNALRDGAGFLNRRTRHWDNVAVAPILHGVI
jgi:hypothetical protein